MDWFLYDRNIRHERVFLTGIPVGDPLSLSLIFLCLKGSSVNLQCKPNK